MFDPDVDPELLAGLDLLPPFVLTKDSLAQYRESAAQFLPPAASYERANVLIEEHEAPGLNGAPPVRFFLYRPRAVGGPLPLLLFVHGGGYVLGLVEGNHPGCVRTADELQCIVASVDYRLAPETRAPGQVEDCYAVLAHLHARAAELDIDAQRVAVGGESAGGGIAAALALMVRDKGEYGLCFQQLIYPMLDDRTCIRADMPEGVGRHVWTADANRFGWEALLGQPPGSGEIAAYAAAARAEDLGRLPPAYISVGSLDLFVEEDMEYARRLMSAGVPVELHVLPRAYHGFELNLDSELARRSEAERRLALARAFAAAPSGRGPA
ncbi:alpha/beta hydrolase [Sphingobium sp. WCS2017Hpa-17]|uniref:alpha/beta hydrolase n=1 Tax=Sphingobium sp. WCS2017Hpa-17 TaxID=3073638 RepID=UPI00288AFFC6|nr:alpha/beta hydrolase [Sphingobium sp. WCS2017Hpa-17]